MSSRSKVRSRRWGEVGVTQAQLGTSKHNIDVHVELGTFSEHIILMCMLRS
jgi:hypothetical protein